MATNLHTVAVEDWGPGRAAVVGFRCAGDSSASCHQYPADCDCEDAIDEHRHGGHPNVPHDRCWVQGWFDIGLGAIEYDGDDATDEGWPTLFREGPVHVRVEDGDRLVWEWES